MRLTRRLRDRHSRLIALIRCFLLSYRTIAATGESGLQSTFAVIARLLRPTESESRGLFLGDLIVQLLRNAGPAVAPVLPDLVKAIVERIPTATYTTYQQVRLESLPSGPAKVLQLTTPPFAPCGLNLAVAHRSGRLPDPHSV